MKKDSEYYLDMYCKTRASELDSLLAALICVADDDSRTNDILKYYVEAHETDKNFEEEVAQLNYSNMHKLAVILVCSSYYIGKPWFKRFLLRAAKDKHNYWAERYLNYYKNLFDKVED